MMNKLLLIVDPQVDFVDGSLPVTGAAEAMDGLARYVKDHGAEYAKVVVTSDWHPYHHSSFLPEGGPWPVHCVQNSAGAALWQSLIDALGTLPEGYALLYKGDLPEREEYSIMQNAQSSKALRRLVEEGAIDRIDICGLAGNVCVMNTAKDLLGLYGAQCLAILGAFSPSLDDGSQLDAFVAESGIAVI